MTIAETARANAISFEVKKDGLAQRQSGDWQLRFTVSSVDMDQRLATAPMGARFQCVLVEVNDDETPADHKTKERDKWRELGPVKQSALRCLDPVFWAFLREHLHYHVDNDTQAAVAVRHFLGVTSRSELDKPGKMYERERWHSIDYQFQAWKAREHG